MNNLQIFSYEKIKLFANKWSIINYDIWLGYSFHVVSLSLKPLYIL